MKLLTSLLPLSVLVAVATAAAPSKPNIILMMADDLGYGDTGFNGNKTIKTPHLDQMAKDGAKLTHFYAGGPVCSPTRGTCLTGRHYYRYGIWSANVGHLPKQEITLARMLKEQGYTTGHFGKRAPRHAEHDPFDQRPQAQPQGKLRAALGARLRPFVCRRIIRFHLGSGQRQEPVLR